VPWRLGSDVLVDTGLLALLALGYLIADGLPGDLGGALLNLALGDTIQ
jgi:hypothetical protein